MWEKIRHVFEFQVVVWILDAKFMNAPLLVRLALLECDMNLSIIFDSVVRACEKPHEHLLIVGNVAFNIFDATA